MRSTYTKGILLMLGATAVLSCMDATMKQLAGYYPAIQVAALRGLMSLPFILAWVWWKERSLATLVRVRWRWHLLRGVLAVVLLTSFIFAISRMPLSEAFTLFFIAPLLITALSVPLLKESVEWQRWVAIGIGFVGVLIALRPGFGVVGWSAVAALVAAACYALNVISIRFLGRWDSTESMAFWFMAFLALGAGVLAAPDWVSLRLRDTGWLVGMGATGALGHTLLTEAAHRAPSSVIAPFEYTTLFWSLLLDLVVWGEVPGPPVFAGAVILVGSGLYLIRREHLVEPVSTGLSSTEAGPTAVASAGDGS